MGKYQQLLEKELSNFLGLKNVVLFSSCRNAFYALLLSLNLNKDDEVIIQSFTCNSMHDAIRRAGGKLILVDVNEDNFNLDFMQVEKKITKKTKIIIFTHTYGNPSGIKEILTLCEKHKLILIEDIAHALGASYEGKPAGTFGDYAVYSFTKQVVNFGGGALATSHDIEKITALRNQFKKSGSFLTYCKRFMASLYETKAFFLSKLLIDFARKKNNLKLTNTLDPHFHCSKIEAWLALKQIKSLEKNNALRKRNFELLGPEIKSQLIEKKAVPSYNYIPFIFPSKEKRDLAAKNNFLFLPPWSGSKISDILIFVPNNPSFSKRKISSLAKVYKRFSNPNS